MEATILIPVRNGMPYICEAIDSCIKQVSKYSFEILIVNDNSDDSTEDILQIYASEVETFSFFNSVGKGISDALNFGMSIAHGEYIVRLDSDDVMLPGRLDAQIDFLKSNPGYVAVGGQIQLFSKSILETHSNFYPTGEELRIALATGCFMAHPAVCFRRESVMQIGGYRRKFDGAEDYDLWLRLSLIGQLANIPNNVTKYRIHENQITRKNYFRSLVATTKVRLAWILGESRLSVIAHIRPIPLNGDFKIKKWAMLLFLVKDLMLVAKRTLSKFSIGIRKCLASQ
jgi:glycosyltransferase involved in cell wall biosynthesis